MDDHDWFQTNWVLMAVPGTAYIFRWPEVPLYTPNGKNEECVVWECRVCHTRVHRRSLRGERSYDNHGFTTTCGEVIVREIMDR